MVTANASEAQPTGGPPAPRGGIDSRWWVAVLVVAAAAALFWPRSENSKTTVPGGFAIDAAGRPVKLGPRMAPVTLVHFWATWCAPCVEEIPALERFRNDLADRHDFRVILIAVADNPEKVRSFLGLGQDDSVLFDPSWDVAHRFGSTQIPETYLIDRGEVVEKFIGATDWSNPAVRKRIEDRL